MQIRKLRVEKKIRQALQNPKNNLQLWLQLTLHLRRCGREKAIEVLRPEKMTCTVSSELANVLQICRSKYEEKNSELGLRKTMQIFMAKCMDKIPCICSNLYCEV
jgi:hypothetical protein